MASESAEQHRRQAGKVSQVNAAILTISDTRTQENDKSGALIKELLEAHSFQVSFYDVLKDDVGRIRKETRRLLEDPAIDVILTTGGTGIGPRDGTIEAIQDLLEKPLPGFGEIFRMLSWHEVTSAAMLSRAIAGIAGHTLIFSMPGSSNAVRLAMEKLILPELRHLVLEMRGRES